MGLAAVMCGFLVGFKDVWTKRSIRFYNKVAKLGGRSNPNPYLRIRVSS